ncbi:MAG: hypothetical protein Q4D74_07445 [Comamonadaceae bacterium]|nr:hypothetical protein [Comamonadaceae bacterium]RRD56051.1 hypothetical protein EII20_12470 [Comamonadaceae bacterium OH2545_COT-014]
MLPRLFIIALFLCLPIAIALLSQLLANKVAPPELSGKVIEVKLGQVRATGRAAADAANGEVPQFYVPRSVKQVHSVDEEPAPAGQDAAPAEAPAASARKEGQP